MNIQYPKIGGGSPTQQIEQIRGFLIQLVEQLNMEKSGGAEISQQTRSTDSSATLGMTEKKGETQAAPGSTFNSIKSLIIKSADIIDAYYTEIDKRLESVYVAESEFGTYKRQAAAELSATADSIKQVYESLQEMREETIDTRAVIRQGLLFTVGEENLEPELGQVLPDGTEIYGVEIGQRTEMNGIEVFNKFARFTAYGMTLYDKNGSLAAYITDNRMKIPNAEIKNTLRRGGFEETILADGSSVERWVGV